MLVRDLFAALLSTAALVGSGCAVGEAEDVGEDVGETASALVTPNGTSLNGTSLNGTSLNGITLNGTSLNGTSLNGTSLNGTSLQAFSADGAPLEGADLVGATLTGTTESGGSVTLRIDAVTQASDQEVYFYTVSYMNGTQWSSICGYDAGGAAIPAIALHGIWDLGAGTTTGGDHIDSPGMITFGCATSALAKCVTLGYKPWKSVQECSSKTSCQARSLRPFHQACTRMLRADYCGDGTPHTLSNVPVNVWDNVQIQKQAKVGNDWKLEAEWTSEGSACIKDLRYNPHSETSEYIDAHCPERKDAAFSCFGSNSTFFSAYGYSTPLPQRSLIRVEYDYDFVYGNTRSNSDSGDDD